MNDDPDLPAFPIGGTVNLGSPRQGLTRRDYFAAAALTGLLSNADAFVQAKSGIVTQAYAFADAMLAERAKEPGA